MVSRLTMTNANKKFALAAVAILAVVVSVIALQASRRGPKYKGQSVDAWLESYNTPQSLNWPRRDSPADEAIRELGTNCFPAIVQRLRVRDSKAMRQVVRIVNALRSPIELKSQVLAHREALGALGALGMTAIPVVPQLADAVESMDPSSAVFAGFWLESLGSDAEAAIPVYLRILNNQSNQVHRHFAVQTLSAIGGRQRELVLPALVASLSDSNQFVRLQATNEMTREQWSTPKLQLVQRTQRAGTWINCSMEKMRRELERSTFSDRSRSSRRRCCRCS